MRRSSRNLAPIASPSGRRASRASTRPNSTGPTTSSSTSLTIRGQARRRSTPNGPYRRQRSWRRRARKTDRSKGKGRPKERPFCFRLRVPTRLRRVVHLELDRMRGVLEADDLRHLQLDVAVDEVVVEHATGLEEGTVLVEFLERLAERAAHRRD